MESDNQKAASEVQIQAAKFTPRRTPAEQKEALDAALAIDPGFATWSARALQMYLDTLIVCFCAEDSGFDNTVMGGINAIQQCTYFGLSGSDSKMGYVYIAWMPRFGRRFGMFIGNALLIIGALITALADNTAAAKSHLAEITPPQSRGAYLGFLNSFYDAGQMTATGMMISTGSYSSEWSWRLPLFVQVVPAALTFLFVCLCPESSRWLYAPMAIQLIALAIEEIEEKVSLEGAALVGLPTAVPHAWRPMAHSLHVDGSGFFGRLSGNGLTRFIALLGSFMVDRTGRRSNLLAGTGSLGVILAIVSGMLRTLACLLPDDGNAGIALIYLFMVVYSAGYTAMQTVYPAEVLSYEARTKGLASLGICTQSMTLITTFGCAIFLFKLSAAVQCHANLLTLYLVYMVWVIFEWIVIYLFVVKTKGLTLEEITERSEQENPQKYSTQKRRSRAGQRELHQC
ncbi:major facilitator superfamily domain-containing protein [Mycena galopus ATCC 62051]|nr:major facilitator superfamily domain-containing protein [Mycena galopus ATCC 62051]